MGGDAKELMRWTRRLTAPLAGVAEPPVRVEAHAGRGLHVLLYAKAGGFLHLCLTPASETREAALRTAVTSLRYMGDRSPTEGERVWLEAVKAAVSGVEGREGWRDFLSWAFSRPAMAISTGSSPDERITSGEAALIRINTKCNARCEFCSARGVLPDLVEEPARIRKRILAAVGGGQTLVSFTGGEPTLEKKLPEFIRTARDEGIGFVDVQTNGILLARREMVQNLADAGMTSIFLSLHSADEVVHDSMLKVEGAFEKAVKTVDLCLRAGVEVRYNCVLTTLNLEGVVDFVRFIGDRFDQENAHVCLSFIALQGWALDHPELIPRLFNAAPKMAAALDAGGDLGLDVRIPGLCGVPICVLPGYEERFDEYHDTSPPPLLPTRSFVTACEKCPHRPRRCSGFWTAYIDRFGDSELGPN